ncbi:acyltransferase family protein [Paenibacillus oleatilyticus]|uniref:acyltransferase family protein n=1 Tax=Paenibacillus oleatilyticus TaxID=2594886 RepID=UPI001C1FBF2E|nr:acyltransferase family protein [Paenibacillus oleatilyticus]MBU7315503.1 acetyltransferase [Paenibacillus oleatilyticus]
MPSPIEGKSRYMPGIDGLRALAVLAVIAYHLHPGWAPGGLLGVGIFFVLSGYLITDLLIAEWRREGRLNLKSFWLRRFRRLLPAMLVLLSAVAAWIWLVDRSRLPALQGDFLAALAYVSNWWLVYREVSYFESLGPPSPLGHFWSLAVEEQFYLLWPLLLALGLRLQPRRGWLAGAMLVGAAASAAAMALLYEPGTDPSRIYYGTDTRAFGLLIGAALAVVWPSGKLSTGTSVRVRRIVDSAGTAGLFAVLLMIVRSGQYDAFLYQGGFVLLSLAVAVTVAALAHPSGQLGRILGCQPLRWLGVRSYGIYLWHYPVIVLTGPPSGSDGISLARAALQLTATIGLAALSWKFVEEPIRRRGVKAWGAQLFGRYRKRLPQPDMRWIVSALLILFICASCLGESPQPPTVTNALAEGSEGIAVPAPAPAPQPDQGNGTGTVTEASGPKTDEAAEAVAETAPPVTPEAAPEEEAGTGVTAIGDSVLLGTAAQLEKQLPGIVIDGKVGRQLAQAQEVADRLRSKGKLGSRIIIELGTNGAFSKKQLESLLHSLADARQIVLVNTRVPRPWEGTVNDMLKEASDRFANTTLVDWHAASAGKASFFAADGVHLNAEGAEYYASLLAKAVRKPRSSE